MSARRPGAEEEQQGEPFVGPAGQLLTKMIKAMGLERSEVYIGNIMNWRPELPPRGGGPQVGNREPTPEEMAFCLPFIDRPDRRGLPGDPRGARRHRRPGFAGRAQLSQHWATCAAAGTNYRGRPLRVTYHPSYLLRKEAEGKTAEQRAKRAAWEDFLAVMERAGLPITDKQRNYFL